MIARSAEITRVQLSFKEADLERWMPANEAMSEKELPDTVSVGIPAVKLDSKEESKVKSNTPNVVDVKAIV